MQSQMGPCEVYKIIEWQSLEAKNINLLIPFELWYLKFSQNLCYSPA